MRNVFLKKSTFFTVITAFLLSFCCGAPCAAAPVELPEEIVTGSSAEDDRELSPGAVTVLRLADRQGEQKSLPDLLETVPGLSITRLSGRNGYTVATVRGSTSSQVAVYIDGILLNLQSEPAVDLSAIPVENADRVEVYRGYIPARFGAQAMGGVINIVTRVPKSPETRFSLGIGSFGHYKAAFSHIADAGKGHLLAAGSYERSKGNFNYSNDNGTPYTREDDYLATRKDNGFDNSDVLLKWNDTAWQLRGAWVRKNRDLPLSAPGLDKRNGSAQMSGARLETDRYELSAARRWKSGTVDWGTAIDYTRQQKNYDSRRGSSPSLIGGAYVSTSRYDSERLAYRFDAAAPLGAMHYLELLFEGWRETLNVQGDVAYHYLGGQEYFAYDGYTLQLQDSITLDKKGSLIFTPSVRWHRQNEMDETTWQAGLDKNFGGGFGLKASGGTYARSPNIYEQFGDGAFILPAAENLRGETGTQWDIGIQWAGEIGKARTTAAATVFGRRTHDLIEFEMESPRYGRHKNVSDAEAKGLELEFSAELNVWKIEASASYLNAKGDQNARLPNSPEWRGTARLTRNVDKGIVYLEAQYTGGNYGDAGNTIYYDSRTVLNAGFKYAISPSVKLYLGVDDLFDQANEWRLRAVGTGPTRMLWYPVEGRRFYATIEFKI